MPRPMRHLRSASLLTACLALALVACADHPLIEFEAGVPSERVATDTPADVSLDFPADRPGVAVTCRPGTSEWPGIVIRPEAAAWDLSAYGHVEARIVNTGSETLSLALRVDNEGDWTTNPWNSESAYPKPGESVTIRVRFGYSWGQPGFALDTARVSQVLVFLTKPTSEQSFRLESLTAGGEPGEKPPVNPDAVRYRPRGGVLLGAGANPEGALTAEGQGCEARLVEAEGGVTLEADFPAGAQEAVARLTPSVGRLDLREWLEVRVGVRNAGSTAMAPRARLESDWGEGPWVGATEPLAPGATCELTLPFAAGVVTLRTGERAVGESPFESDRGRAIALAAEGEGERKLVVDSLRATVPPAPALPAWLGTRPPTEGAWRQTLAEEFDGPALDEARWSIYHPNYWDKRSHFSRDNAILADGLLTLRFEKRRGHHNDDPTGAETDWATGFLTSTHKWTQRYGYFESRMKLPSAPGMWPAFWMMPDRGPEAGDAREATENGGMEIDVLEYLSRYGPYRYNVAAHWDGYGAEHKSLGSERLYVQPDAGGFYTAGLLWEPGKLTFYCNGAVVAEWSDPRVCSVPMYILYTMVSGGWGGNDLTGEGLPDSLVIDYVRAWQRADLE